MSLKASKFLSPNEREHYSKICLKSFPILNASFASLGPSGSLSLESIIKVLFDPSFYANLSAAFLPTSSASSQR